MKTLRTPEERFRDLPGYHFKAHYCDLPDFDGGNLRVHFLDEGPRQSSPLLLMHGEPSWSYLYRKMIPIFTAADYRVIVPDLVGFGRSDKPTELTDYSFQRHVDWMQALLENTDLQKITLVCQDWGGLIGLRLVADNPDRFSRVVVANTGLPTGDETPSDAFLEWRKLSLDMPVFDLKMVMQFGCARPVADDVLAAYDAPFPDENHKAGARIFPSLVPISADDPASDANRRAWKVLEKFEKPFLTAFSDADPITKGGDKVFQKRIPGAKGQAHTTIENAGHFLQEDNGEDFAAVVLDFITASG